MTSAQILALAEPFNAYPNAAVLTIRNDDVVSFARAIIAAIGTQEERERFDTVLDPAQIAAAFERDEVTNG
ncbi:MAG: hypothetical protein ACRC1H_19565 [Caldilineaceae bacterium]